MEEELLYLAAISAVVVKKRKKRNERKEWARKWLLKRASNCHVHLMNELRMYPKDWHNFIRMTELTYAELLNLVSPIISKKNTCMRQSISAHEHLSATLMFLATGRSYEDLKFSTKISAQSLGHIIPECCEAIYKSLKDYYKFPSSTEEWRTIGRTFESKWNFPNCLGAIGGKHIGITAPPGAGSYFYNYKHFHSQVLLAIANGNYELIYFHFGTNGRISDGGVLSNVDFYRKLTSDSLHLPPQSNGDGQLPYVFVADEAFSLNKYFLKPFNKNQLTKERRIYNYRLCRARRIIENVFGIIVSRFHVLKNPININLANVTPVVMACCALHNFLRRKNPDYYSPSECFDRENYEQHKTAEGYHCELPSLERLRNTASEDGKAIRQQFMEYFNNAGKVPWQEDFC